MSVPAQNVFDPLAYAQSQAGGFDPLAYANAVATGEQPAPAPDNSVPYTGKVSDALKNLGNQAHEFGSALGHEVLGGYAGLIKMLSGEGLDAAADAVNDVTSRSYQAPKVNYPRLPGGLTASEIGGGAFGEGPPEATHQLAEGVGGASPASGAALEALPAALGGFKGAAKAELGAASEAEQAARADLLRRVGVTETRKSVLEGDPQASANEYQESKLNSPNGTRIKGVIDNERQALSDHADRIVADTGGTEGSATDEATRIERGNNILKPLDDLKEHFDQGIKNLYNAADQRAAGTPVTLNGFKDVLGDDSEMTNSDRVHLRQGLNAYLGKLNMVGEDGTVSGTVQQAETARKYLNEHWSPQNSKLVGKLKDAIDDDVTQAAGDDIYSQARALRTLRSQTLDDPNGIAKIMDSSGPEGINRKVPVEKVADTLTSLPVAQFNHVIKILKNLPPDLQESGDTALNEVKAHMASKIAGVGQSTASLWNAKGVTQALSQNSARLKSVFTPEELAKFQDLDQAGQLLKKDQSYPGAAVQEHNLVRAGAMAAIRGGATAAGAHLGPLGAVAGEYVGGKAANKLSDAMLRKNAESRIVQLSNQ